MKTHFLYNSFSTTKENMEFDIALTKKVNTENRYIRYYKWLNIGLTIPFGRELPNDLSHIDHSVRPTGGGIVFHCPGDILLTWVMPKSDKNLHSKLKSQLNLIKTIIQESFIKINRPLNTSSTKENKYDQFCVNYYNPFELYLENKKIVGLTLKHHKDYTLIQGIIHISTSLEHFKNKIPDHYLPLLNSVFEKKIPTKELLNKLKVTTLDLIK